MAVTELEKWYADRCHLWRLDISAFVYEGLNLGSIPGFKITDQQSEFLQAVQLLVMYKWRQSLGQPMGDEELRIAVKIGVSIMSGRGTGKDAAISWVILWYLLLFQKVKIAALAVNMKHLKAVLWPEIREWLAHSPLRDLYFMKKEEITLTGKSENFCQMRSATSKNNSEDYAEALAGLHSPNQMVVCDEASGFKDSLFKPLRATITGACNFLVLLFNPTKNYGFAYESHYVEPDEWMLLQWNAEESPLVNQNVIDYSLRKFGRDSDDYRINILGKPPVASDGALIINEWVNFAAEQELDIPADYPRVLGIDVGGGGDDTVIQPRRGGNFEKKITIRLSDDQFLEEEIAKVIKGFQAPDQPPLLRVVVDDNGLGWGVCEGLKRRFGKTLVRGIKAQMKPRDKARFASKRDELAWKLREMYMRGEASFDKNDRNFIAQCAIIRYTDDGVVKIEDKKSMKSRGLSSPNEFDAQCYSLSEDDSLYDHSSEFSRRTSVLQRASRFRSSQKTSWMSN